MSTDGVSWELICWTCISVLGVSGNVVVLYVIWRSGPEFRSCSYNLWLAFLATADFILSILVLPFYIISTSVWKPTSGEQGDILCIIGVASTSWLERCSIYHLVGISLERYNVVVNPLSALARDSKLRTKIKIAACWILSFLAEFLVQTFLDKIKYSRQNPTIGNHCTIQWPNLIVSQTGNVVLFLLQYIVPLAVLVYTSVRITQHLRHQERAFINDAMGSNSHEIKRLENRKKRSLRTLTMVVAAFFVCQTPSHVMWISLQLKSSVFWNTYYFQMALLLATFNSFLNCVLYSFMSDEFRTHFSLTFPNISRLWHRLSFTCKFNGQMSRKPLIKSDAQKESAKFYGSFFSQCSENPDARVS